MQRITLFFLHPTKGGAKWKNWLSTDCDLYSSWYARSGVYCYRVRVSWSLPLILIPTSLSSHSHLLPPPVWSSPLTETNPSPRPAWGWWGWWGRCCVCWWWGAWCRWSSSCAMSAGVPALCPSQTSPMTSVMGFVEVRYLPNIYQTLAVTTSITTLVNLVTFEYILLSWAWHPPAPWEWKIILKQFYLNFGILFFLKI